MPKPDLVGFAIWTADGFFDNAKSWSEKRNGAEGLNPIAPVVGPGVNLNLAAELYLKATMMCLGNKPQKWHDLAKLYRSLPLNFRNQLQDGYEQLLAAKPRDQSSFTKHILRVGPKLERLEEQAKSDKKPILYDTSLVGMLDAHSKSFVTLRYVHELNHSPDTKHEYDFHAMVVATEAFRQVAHQLAVHKGYDIEAKPFLR